MNKSAKNSKEKNVTKGDDAAMAAVAVKEKTPEERKAAHIQSIIKTAIASIIGIIAGIVAFNRLGDATTTKWYAILVIIAILAYYAQRIIYRGIKIDTKEFGPKDWFYVEFLVVDFCLVTWTLLLN